MPIPVGWSNLVRFQLCQRHQIEDQFIGAGLRILTSEGHCLQTKNKEVAPGLPELIINDREGLKAESQYFNLVPSDPTNNDFPYFFIEQSSGDPRPRMVHKERENTPIVTLDHKDGYSNE